MRLQTSILVNIQLPKGKKVSPEELIRFEWDKNGIAKPKLLTREERKKLFEKEDKAMKRRYGIDS